MAENIQKTIEDQYYDSEKVNLYPLNAAIIGTKPVPIMAAFSFDLACGAGACCRLTCTTA